MVNDPNSLAARFPITDKESAIAALNARGKAKDKRERRAVILKAMKFAPDEARAVLEQDTKANLVE